MASSMEKKLTELEMGLLHLQQNIDIPEITLTVHPQWQTRARACGVWRPQPRIDGGASGGVGQHGSDGCGAD